MAALWHSTKSFFLFDDIFCYCSDLSTRESNFVIHPFFKFISNLSKKHISVLFLLLSERYLPSYFNCNAHCFIVSGMKIKTFVELEKISHWNNTSIYFLLIECLNRIITFIMAFQYKYYLLHGFFCYNVISYACKVKSYSNLTVFVDYFKNKHRVIFENLRLRMNNFLTFFILFCLQEVGVWSITVIPSFLWLCFCFHFYWPFQVSSLLAFCPILGTDLVGLVVWDGLGAKNQVSRDQEKAKRWICAFMTSDHLL